MSLPVQVFGYHACARHWPFVPRQTDIIQDRAQVQNYPVSDNKGIRNARSPERRRGVRVVMSSPHEGVFDYGGFECDSGLAYRSVCLFGRIRIVADSAIKQQFCEALMAKYGKPESERPKGFFP